jgi:hypothetical protein
MTNLGITESDAREEGYRAYQDGLSSNDNPFNNNEEWDLHLAWKEGRKAGTTLLGMTELFD